MKKFLKWAWYNKEQLFSILYNVVVLALSQIAMWTGWLEGMFPNVTGTGLVIMKISICILALAFTALTVRNICVKYGLSSLDTIDKVLAERAEAASNKLTPEQKAEIKKRISSLQATLDKWQKELKTAETALAEMNLLYSTSANLVENYVAKKAAYEKKITDCSTVITSVEQTIVNCKACLNGTATKSTSETTENK